MRIVMSRGPQTYHLADSALSHTFLEISEARYCFLYNLKEFQASLAKDGGKNAVYRAY